VAAHPPIWLETLIDIVSNCIEAHSAMGSLAYEYRTEEDLTELIVYPTPVELVGGAVDGAIVVPGFSLDLLALQSAFERVEAVYWQAQGMGPHDLEGPQLWVEGTYQEHAIWLRVLSEPPPEAEPGLRLDTSGPGPVS
jgi:hypothetical protein